MSAHFIQSVLRCIACINSSLLGSLGKALGTLYGFIPGRDRTIAIQQIKMALPEVDASQVARKMFASLGQTTLESLAITSCLRREKPSFTFDNEPLLQKLLTQEKPIVALTAHTGNWDLMAAHIVKRGGKLTTVGTKARNQSLQSALAHIREDYGIRMLWRSGKAGAADVMKELKDNRIVAALIDQDTRVSSCWCTFFGEPAKCPSGIIALAKRCNATIVTCFNVRTAPRHYMAYLDVIDSSQSIEAIIQEYNNRLEAIVRQHPEQWVWIHKRWRSPSQDITMSSREYLEFLEQKIAHAS